MNRIISGLILSTVFLLNSCGPHLEEENKKMRKELLAVHDEVMPQMGKLKSLEKKANHKLEELNMQVPVDSIEVEKLKDLVVRLNSAYEGMFVWMRQYKTEDGEKDPIAVKAYLEEQMVQVTDVNQTIKSVLLEAKKKLND
jgi:hypothetical protein